MTLTELKKILKEEGIYLTRKMGQNFLIDENLLQVLVNKAKVQSTDFILEIGTGLGALTQVLLQTGAVVVSYEYDNKIFQTALKRFSQYPNLVLLHENFLKADFLKHFTVPPRVIANIPYNIASQILIRLWSEKEKIADLILLVQKEMAERFLSLNNSNVSFLSVLFQLDYKMTILRKVPHTAFFPSPEVDSVYLEMVPKPLNLNPQERRIFFQFVKEGFSQKRKQLLPRLARQYEKAPAVFESLGLPKESRPESLAPEDWFALFKQLAGKSLPPSPAASGKPGKSELYQ
jgi:16S rRNA (adenine1518-N6/adenine1519-N6)-dimethyltransferase